MMIRNARLEDLQAIVEIEQENFSDMAASLETMKERILTIPDTFLVAEIDGAVAGYIEGPVVPQRYLTDDLFHRVEKKNRKWWFYCSYKSFCISTFSRTRSRNCFASNYERFGNRSKAIGNQSYLPRKSYFIL